MLRVPPIPLEWIYEVRDIHIEDGISIRERMFLTRYNIALGLEREVGRER